MKKLKHKWYYISLFGIFLLGLLLLLSASFSKQLQMSILIMLSFFYVGLGILHHGIHHTLSAKIVIEYVIVATFGISVMLFVFQGVL